MCAMDMFKFTVTLTRNQVPITPMDNAKAIDQMEAAYATLLSRPVKGGATSAYKSRTAAFAKDGEEHPRLITLGGDHTIVGPLAGFFARELTFVRVRRFSPSYGP